jgi:hypothetical protein
MKRRWSLGVLAAIIVAICVATAPRAPEQQVQADVQFALSLSPAAVTVRTAGFTLEIRI